MLSKTILITCKLGRNTLNGGITDATVGVPTYELPRHGIQITASHNPRLTMGLSSFQTRTVIPMRPVKVLEQYRIFKSGLSQSACGGWELVPLAKPGPAHCEDTLIRPFIGSLGNCRR